MGSNYFGKNLVFLRSATNLSQQAFADAIGVNRGNIDSYERGSQPKPEIMLRIANYFNIELQALIAIELDSDNYSKYTKSVLMPGSKPNEFQDGPDPAKTKDKFTKSQFLELMSRIRQEQEADVRASLTEEAILMVCTLEDEANLLKTELLEYLRKQVK